MSLVRLSRRGMASVGISFGLALLVSGCVNNDLSISITQFVPPDSASATSGTCLYDPTTTVAIARGTYDIAAAQIFGSGYTAAFIVRNNLLPVEQAPIEENTYYVNSYNVELELQGAVTAVIPAASRAFNYQNASIQLLPGMSAIGFAQIFGPDQVVSLKALEGGSPGTVIAHVRPVVTRAEEQHIGAEASFPIDLCVGCLIGGETLPACPLNITKPAVGNPCNFAADSPVNCCASGNTPLCGMNALPKS